MRTLMVVAVALMVSGCRTTTPYASIFYKDTDMACVSRCKSMGAVRGAAGQTECYASCNADVRREQECYQYPKYQCVDTQVSRFSFWKTALLVGGVVAGGVALTALATAYNNRNP